jgi:hypothetical protein
MVQSTAMLADPPGPSFSSLAADGYAGQAGCVSWYGRWDSAWLGSTGSRLVMRYPVAAVTVRGRTNLESGTEHYRDAQPLAECAPAEE